MNAHPEINHLATDDRIRAIAYSIWEEEGRPEGCSEEHWFRALALVASEAEPSTGLSSQTDLQPPETATMTEPPATEQAPEKATKRGEARKAA